MYEHASGKSTSFVLKIVKYVTNRQFKIVKYVTNETLQIVKYVTLFL